MSTDIYNNSPSVHARSGAMKLSEETVDWLVFWGAHATLSQLTIGVFMFTVRCQQDDLKVIMFTLNTRRCAMLTHWGSVTCNLVPTKNKSLVLCHPIVLAPVFAIILPSLRCCWLLPQKACFILQQFYTETSYCATEHCSSSTRNITKHLKAAFWNHQEMALY